MALTVTICTLEALWVVAVAYYEEAAENHIGVLWLKLKTHASFLVYLSTFISGWGLVCICHLLQLYMQIVFITYPMNSATTLCVSYPQHHSSSSSFYGIPSLFFFHKYMSATTIMVWSVFPKFQSRKQCFLYSGSFLMGMLQMEGRRSLSMSLVLAHCYTQKNRVETFFLVSFALAFDQQEPGPLTLQRARHHSLWWSSG